MSLFTPHPCGNVDNLCEKYGKCDQFKCEKFTKWFNDVYQQMMTINYMYDQGRVVILKEKPKENEVFKNGI